MPSNGRRDTSLVATMGAVFVVAPSAGATMLDFVVVASANWRVNFGKTIMTAMLPPTHTAKKKNASRMGSQPRCFRRYRPAGDGTGVTGELASKANGSAEAPGRAAFTAAAAGIRSYGLAAGVGPTAGRAGPADGKGAGWVAGGRFAR